MTPDRVGASDVQGQPQLPLPENPHPSACGMQSRSRKGARLVGLVLSLLSWLDVRPGADLPLPGALASAERRGCAGWSPRSSSHGDFGHVSRFLFLSLHHSTRWVGRVLGHRQPFTEHGGGREVSRDADPLNPSPEGALEGRHWVLHPPRPSYGRGP